MVIPVLMRLLTAGSRLEGASPVPELLGMRIAETPAAMQALRQAWRPAAFRGTGKSCKVNP
jgi:hypothetical protein